MAEQWLVFGGWALNPAILRPLFPGDATIIDINPLMDSIVTGENLVDDWQDRLIDILTPSLPQRPFSIAGWSTGAIAAAALATRINPAAGVFLSATPSFCRRRDLGFSFGTRDTVLKSMRVRLAADPATVVSEFSSNCGLPKQEPYPAAFSLASGLVFLEKACLLPLAPFSFPALFLHGKSDTIVPFDAGRYFCTHAEGTFVECSGPHAFFTGQPEKTNRIITDFLEEAL